MKGLRNRQGQAMVEFGLVIPMVLFLLVFIIESALFMGTFISLQNMSREAARQIAVHKESAATAVTQVQNQLLIGLIADQIHVAYSFKNNGTPVTNVADVKKGHEVEVLASCNYHSLLMSFINLVPGISIPNQLQAKTVMMIEN